MMPYDMCTKDVLKDIFAGNKGLMRLKDVNFISVPKYDELSVKNLYGNLLQLPEMTQFFPDKYPKGRLCEREYLFNVANTIHPQAMKELIDYAHKHRHDFTGGKQQQEAVLATDHWAEELRSMPFYSKVSTTTPAQYLFRDEARCHHS